MAARLFPADPRKRMEVLVDVLSSCNLRCPSCPVGNMGAINPASLIDKGLFTRLIEKATTDYHITQVSLYNWAEPVLHPELPELIRIVRGRGVPCHISSNLNLLRNVEEILRAGPEFFRISLSGFTQEVYARAHVRGDIEQVKENMRILSEAKKKTKNKATKIEVFYHKYRHNLHEVEPMRAFAEGLGFAFTEAWAYLMPAEKVMDLAEGKLVGAEREFVETQFALPIAKAVEASRRFRHEPCRMLDQQIVLDLRGNLILCCGVYDYEKNGVGSFLEMTPEGLERAKRAHPTCSRCVRNGIHTYLEYFTHPQLRPIYDGLARENLL
ncbi:MAG TPA: radical SAM protein [Planctomycetota bacterium]|nr:radical SAM protein [Planctomycetota bacterium]